MFETFENQLLSISTKVTTTVRSVTVGLFVFLYFANGLLTLAISNDKCHLNVTFVNDVFILFVMYVIAYLSYIGIFFFIHINIIGLRLLKQGRSYN